MKSRFQEIYKICTRCVMDTSDPNITFDENGVCNHCTNFLKDRSSKIQINSGISIGELFEKVKERSRKFNQEFDAVCGLSGGTDSSYSLHLAAKYKVKVLAVHVDNGWDSAAAVQNIYKLIKKLNVNYISYVLDWNKYKNVQKAFLKASVPEADTPTDLATFRGQLQICFDNQIRSIISGGNMSSEGILPVHWHYNARDNKYTKSILKKFKVPYDDYEMMSLDFLKELYSLTLFRIKKFYPLNHVDYNTDRARDELNQIYGWKNYGFKHGESRFTRFLQSYYIFIKHKIDYRRTKLSCDICLNKKTRNECLDILSKPPYEKIEIESEMKYISKKLDINLNEFKSIVDNEGLWYSDYKNNQKLLSILYNLYRFIRREKRLNNF